MHKIQRKFKKFIFTEFIHKIFTIQKKKKIIIIKRGKFVKFQKFINISEAQFFMDSLWEQIFYDYKDKFSFMICSKRQESVEKAVLLVMLLFINWDKRWKRRKNAATLFLTEYRNEHWEDEEKENIFPNDISCFVWSYIIRFFFHAFVSLSCFMIQ